MKKIQIISSLLKNFLPTSRPRFWIYLLGPYFIGLTAWLSDISLQGVRDAIGRQGVWFLIYFSYPANLLVYGVNDIYDYQTDILNDKKKWYETTINPDQYKSLWLAIFILNAPFIFLSILPNKESYLRLFLFVVSSICYSAPPIRAKSKPILDTILSAIIYVAPWIIGYMISWWSHLNMMLIIACIVWNMSMHAYSAIPDIEVDKKAGISTVATLYGAKWTLMFCMILYGLACILSIPALHRWAIVLWVMYIGMMSISFFYPINILYRYFPWINTLCWWILRIMIVWLKIISQ